MTKLTAQFGGKTHTLVLPTDESVPIKEQFGFFPTSVIRPSAQSKDRWADVAYFDDGESDAKKRNDGYRPGTNMSEFHAGMCEHILRYWSLKGSIVVDPFAGRVTRATISSKLGRKYYGYEISPTTYRRSLAHFAKHNVTPTLFNSDGILMSETPDNFADMILTCPPYFNVEKYESCDGQLSDINDYSTFLEKMKVSAENCYRVLKPGAFCVWVVADFRIDLDFISFHSDLANIFTKNGFINYDLVIMENISPFATMSIAQTAYKRYTFKSHEYVMVFRKPGEYDIPEYCESDYNISGNVDKFFSF